MGVALGGCGRGWKAAGEEGGGESPPWSEEGGSGGGRAEREFKKKKTTKDERLKVVLAVGSLGGQVWRGVGMPEA